MFLPLLSRESGGGVGLGPSLPPSEGPWSARLTLPLPAVEAFEEVTDSLCVPQYNRDGEERVVLFLKMAPGHAFRPELTKRIRDAIRLGLSARHVPSVILETKAIPVRLWGCRLPLAGATSALSPPRPARAGSRLEARASPLPDNESSFLPCSLTRPEPRYRRLLRAGPALVSPSSPRAASVWPHNYRRGN